MANTDSQILINERRGALHLSLRFHLDEGWTVLFGPSGSGKSTVLRIIAGLERPGSGRVILRGETLTDAERGVHVPPHRRGVRMLAQSPALFPGRSVRGNVLFGAGSDTDLAAIARLCRIESLLERRSADLSGGERQRVALARTLAAIEGARCLLLDEPFSGLEVSLRDEILADLKLWLAPRRLPVLLVTHDVGEVLASGGRVLRLREGVIVAEGAAEEVLAPELCQLRAALQVSVERR